MTRKVVTAAPEDGIRGQFSVCARRIRHLPILSMAPNLVGMLSDRDLRRPDWVDEAPADLSHDYQIWTTIFVCPDLMSHNRSWSIRRRPRHRLRSDQTSTALAPCRSWTKGNHLVGIISKADLVRAFSVLLKTHDE